MPDGSWITLDRERFEAPEIIFNPAKYSFDMSESPGVAEMVVDSVQGCPVDCRRQLYESIMTSGGTSMFPGFSTRLENDVKKFWCLKSGQKTCKVDVKIKDPPRRKYSVFMGAGIYAGVINSINGGQLDTGPVDEEGTGQGPTVKWITQYDWEELGAKSLKKYT